ncbi:MAG: histidine kinase [Prevotella sp.]|nr:histidine kinase [Prevotella sp.]
MKPIRITKKDILIFALQLAIGATIIGAPAFLNSLTTADWDNGRTTIVIAAWWFLPIIALYLANFYVCVPFLFYGKRRWLFFAINAVLIAIVNLNFFFFDPNTLPTVARASYFAFGATMILLDIFAIALPLGIRHLMRLNDIEMQLKEEKQRNAEAELAWLKNQLNPHFLFNTLNNISSLTQIDAEKAQDSIGQLSDLMRYALYETQKEAVPIGKEIEFMRNYISLMSMRCGETTTVSYNFDVGDEQLQVAPLLFLSPIENAFKHGVSSSKPSFIRISLTDIHRLGPRPTPEGASPKAGAAPGYPTFLCFLCENSNHAKAKTDHSGSGIGVENMRRRLELIYPKRYELEQTSDEESYQISITIHL